MSAALGLCLATRSGRSPTALGQVARQAEDAGFSAVFIAEGNGDVLSVCPCLVRATGKVTIGTAIANAYLHPPTLTAMTAATLDDESAGRFVLGLGTANASLNHDLLGLPPSPLLRMIEEYVGLVRAIWSGQSFHGEVFTLARPFVLDRVPPRTQLPIYLAALQPRMLALAGRIADGVIFTLMSPEQAGDAVRLVRTAAADVGREPTSVSIVCVLQCCLSEDPEQARAAARRVCLRFARHPSAARLFARHDPEGRFGSVLDLLSIGDTDRAAAPMPQDVVDAFVLRGDAQTCRRRIDEYRRAGVDLPVLFPMPLAASWDGVAEAAVSAFGA